MINRLLAVSIDPPLGTGRTVSQTFPNFSALITVILKNSLTIAGILLLILLIFGGVTFIIGAGADDPKKTAQAQTMITDALIGFVVIILAYSIVQIIEVITGVDILNSTL